MIDEQQPNYGLDKNSAPETAKPPRKPRAAKKVKSMQKPVTRGQATAWGALGLTIGQILTLAIGKWLGVH